MAITKKKYICPADQVCIFLEGAVVYPNRNIKEGYYLEFN